MGRRHRSPGGFRYHRRAVAVGSSVASSDVPAASAPDRPRRPAPAKRSEHLTLAVIVIAAVLVRLPSLGNSLFGDELSSYFIVTHHSLGGIVRLLDGHSVDLTPPMYFLLARLVEHLGDSPLALRAVPMAAGTATVPLTYLFGLRTVGRRAGLVGAGLTALSPFLVFYSTEARAYALVMALVVGSTLCLLRALEAGRPAWWAGYALLACGAMYTHYTAVFVLVAQFSWAALAHPVRRRALLVATAAAAAGFVPWIPVLVTNSHSFGTKVFGILEPFTANAVVHDIEHWAVGHPYLPLRTSPGTAGLAAVVLGVVVSVIGLGAQRRQTLKLRVRPLLRSDSFLPVLLALATPLGLVVYSALRQDTWDMRNLISSWPGLAVSAGALITAAPRLRWATVALVGAGFAVGAGQLLTSAHQRPDYAAVARFVKAQGPATDPVAVIVAPTPGPLSAMDAAFAYAGQPNRPLLRIGSPSLTATLAEPPYALLPATPVASLAAQAERAPAGARLFVIAPGSVPLAALLRSGRQNPVRA
ncbi:MAG: mannosyltransferase, partial [Solirubrobacteraceae bacterium]|nr:mannosyltransferase [Solirubrobacteraceae bacterium]